MKILANQNEHEANTAARLESYARRIAALEAELATERARLDWLNDFVQCGCADFGFELDGGVYLRLSRPSSETVDIREANDIRAAIDAAIKGTA